jgi:alpha-tubulin suppressor-like RCC1 family protein
VRGEIGNGTTDPTGCQCHATPAQTSITNVVDLKTAGTHTLARKSDGSIWAWGWNQSGEIGIGAVDTTGCQCRATPVQSNVGLNNLAVGVGYRHSFAAGP